MSHEFSNISPKEPKYVRNIVVDTNPQKLQKRHLIKVGKKQEHM